MRLLHAKQFGSIGELTIAKDLMLRGYSVFTEFGDLSKTDLIALVDDKPFKVQVKTCTLQNGGINFKIIKSGPNYEYTYNRKDVDFFAVYVPEKETILYIGWNDLMNKKNLRIRFEDSKNNQIRTCNFYTDFTDFNRLINVL